MEEFSGSGSQDRSNDAENENMGNRTKRRRLITYSYESDPEFDNNFNGSGSEDGDETYNPTESDIDKFDSDDSLSFEEATENVDHIATTSRNIDTPTNPEPQSSGKCICLSV